MTTTPDTGLRGPDLFREIAAVIRGNPYRFDMNQFTGSCGATHCIGGWAAFLTGTESRDTSRMEGVLGLTHDQACQLFYAEIGADLGGPWATIAREYGVSLSEYKGWAQLEFDDISADMAADLCERLADGTLAFTDRAPGLFPEDDE